MNAPPIFMQTVAFAAPVGICVAVRRTPARDLLTCSLQMWAYLAAYKSPHDDPAAQERRVRIDYPIIADRALGLGELPSLRLQRSLVRRGPDGPEWQALDRVLVWAHWVWFMVPHGSLVYILVRRRARFARAAVLTYAVFDIGAVVYWLLPTAPPWYAAARGRDDAPERSFGTSSPDVASREAPLRGPIELQVRRMMVEYGEFFWQDRWGALYSVFGGNPLAAMPSLHFATSLMAALLLAEVNPLAGALGWGYTATLGFALVYLGEHYVVDLLAGAALTGTIRCLAPRAQPLARRIGHAVAALEVQARAS